VCEFDSIPVVAQLVYIDETGWRGKGSKGDPMISVVGLIVDESAVQPLAQRFQDLAMEHLGWIPDDFEFHGYENFHRKGYWANKSPDQCIRAYGAALKVLEELNLEVAMASIHKEKLRERYDGQADKNAYLLALQFLLEKIDNLNGNRKIIVADEAKEDELRAISMVSDLQQWGGGLVPGQKLTTLIDSLHFVSSHSSPGVQLADLAAYAIQRKLSGLDTHPDAVAAIDALAGLVWDRMTTWRESWP
jgi:hypothetical protein